MQFRLFKIYFGLRKYFILLVYLQQRFIVLKQAISISLTQLIFFFLTVNKSSHDRFNRTIFLAFIDFAFKILFSSISEKWSIVEIIMHNNFQCRRNLICDLDCIYFWNMNTWYAWVGQKDISFNRVHRKDWVSLLKTLPLFNTFPIL